MAIDESQQQTNVNRTLEDVKNEQNEKKKTIFNTKQQRDTRSQAIQQYSFCCSVCSSFSHTSNCYAQIEVMLL